MCKRHNKYSIFNSVLIFIVILTKSFLISSLRLLGREGVRFWVDQEHGFHMLLGNF